MRWTVAASSVLLVAALSGCGSDSDSETTAAPSPSASSAQSPAASAAAGGDAKGDVTITSCAKDPSTGKAVAKIDVTNSTAAEAIYTFDVKIVAGPYKTGYASTPFGPVIIPGLAPGATASVERTTTSNDVPEPITCSVGDVRRQ